MKNENKNRHDKLLFLALLLASSSFIGTVFIPSGGIILCFFWGFIRGIAGAWIDFLIGMSVIEYSNLQVRLSLSPSQNDSAANYEQTVSVNTAQSSTAKNIGSFVASIATYVFFAKNNKLGETVANTLLVGTAVLFLVAALVSLKFQFHVGNLLANINMQSYNIVSDIAEENTDDTPSFSSTDGMHYTSSSSFRSSSSSEHNESETMEDMATPPCPKNEHYQQMIEVSTLVAFQMLLAVSALQKPIVAVSSQSTWVSLVVACGVLIIFTIVLGYRYEQKSTTDSSLSSPRSHSNKLPHRQLNLYFLLRYSMPIAGFLMYSYLYSVFESDPVFLQLLSVMKTALGAVATFCYEKFLSPYCHSGWPLIGLIACLDIIVGLIALLDVWVIRAVKQKEVDGEYVLDNSLRWLVMLVGLAKYFFAELDYMPALVLSTSNVYTDDGASGVEDQSFEPEDGGSNGEQPAERTSLSDDFPRSAIASLAIDSNYEEDCDTSIAQQENLAPKVPLISAGMQYASFLSCIDFGAQIGDWITVPIVASLGITRENHWDNIDKLVVICSILRMCRVIFLWLICPPINRRSKASVADRNEYSNVDDGVDSN